MRTKLLIPLLLLSSLLLIGCGARLPEPTLLPPEVSYAGNWDTNWGQMILVQQGNHIDGTYKGFRNGSLTGEIRGNLFTFHWTQVESQMWGRGYLQMSQDGKKMEGQWGYQKDYTNGGRWWATRD